MIPFEYVRVSSAQEAVALLAEHGDEAKLIAGGHSLLPLMKLRLATPTVLIDVGRVGELRYIRREGDEIAIGALTRHSDIETSKLCPLLSAVAHRVGDPQVRHRGTIGGSLAHGDPASDLPAAVLALGGTLTVLGPNGERRIEMAEFGRGFLETALGPDEMLTEIRVPDVASFGFEKFTRRAQDWAIVGVVVADRRVALVNMGTTVLRAATVESALMDGASAAEAAELAHEGTEPPTDINGSAEYRAHLARVLTRRALTAAGVA